MCRQFQMMGLYPFKEVFLQHGVIMNTLPFLEAARNHIDLFMASTPAEKEEICSGLGYRKEQVPLTGLCRYDRLNDFTVNPKQILVMPTWRQWLYPPFGKTPADVEDEVRESNYVQTYMKLLSDERLIRFLEEQDLTLLFFPHNQMQPFLEAFASSNPRIVLASTAAYDVQTALKESAFLVTDYSSILFDFAYMKKPACYFQFDYEEFREKHYPEGYFSYVRNGFGDVVRTTDDLIDTLMKSCAEGFCMPEEYVRRVDATFIFRDDHNCQRNLEAIEQLLQRKKSK